MNNKSDELSKLTIWERHAQTVLVLILTALLLWVGNTTQETAVAIAKMETEVAHLRDSLNDDNDRFANIESRLGSIEAQLAALTAESRVR